MSMELTPGRRIVFPNCEFLQLTRYDSSDRKGNPIWLYRHTFKCALFTGQLVYTGKNLEIAPGSIVHIKATIKRLEKLGVNFLRISRPILLDNPDPLPLEESQTQKG